MPAVYNDSQQIHFDEHGEGPAVVLGHSFLFDGGMWKHQVPVLAERFRVINIDFRGHGASGPVTGPFTLYDAVADVIAVLDHLGVGRAAWCGLSVGGMVALRAAITHPDRVSRLVLLDTDAGAEQPYQRAKYAAMVSCARRTGVKPFLPLVTPLMFGRSARRRGLSEIEEFRQDLVSRPFVSIRHAIGAISRRDSLLSVLDEITVPALVLVGEEDRGLPPARSQRLSDELPNARFVQIPQAGHVCTLEQPDAVNHHLMQFLTDGDPW